MLRGGDKPWDDKKMGVVTVISFEDKAFLRQRLKIAVLQSRAVILLYFSVKMPRTTGRITVFSSQITTKRSNAFPGIKEVGETGAMTPLPAANASRPKSAAAMLKIGLSVLAPLYIPSLRKGRGLCGEGSFFFLLFI
jgi:hypothetical protein